MYYLNHQTIHCNAALFQESLDTSLTNRMLSVYSSLCLSILTV